MQKGKAVPHRPNCSSPSPGPAFLSTLLRDQGTPGSHLA